MKNQLLKIEAKLKKLKSFKHGSELTSDVDLTGLTDGNMNDIAGFFEFKKHSPAFSYLRKMKLKYNCQ